VKTVDQEFPAPPVRTSSALQALELVLQSVGASLPKRDAVDARIVESVRRRDGSIIDSQQQVGGWPELEPAKPPTDSDGDGIPDVWERHYGLNPQDFSDGSADKDGDGYSNLEEYLNGTDPRRPGF